MSFKQVNKYLNSLTQEQRNELIIILGGTPPSTKGISFNEAVGDAIKHNQKIIDENSPKD